MQRNPFSVGPRAANRAGNRRCRQNICHSGRTPAAAAIAARTVLLDNRASGEGGLETDMLDKASKDKPSALPQRLREMLGLREPAGTPKGLGPKRPRKEPEERKQHFATWYVFAAFLGVMMIQFLWLRFSQVETVPYSQFQQLLDEEKIVSVVVGSD